MREIFLSIAFFSPLCLFAQTDIDTLFSGYTSYKVESVRKDSTGEYYKLKDFPGKIYYWSKNWSLKIFDKDSNLIVEGKIGYRVCSQLVLKSGKWRSYYPDGQVKTEGYYQKNQPIGLWRMYYPEGGIKRLYNLARIASDSTASICTTGTYEEYYESGQVKISGVYEVVNDTVNVSQYDFEPPFVKREIIVRMPVSKKAGIWLYYLPNGEVEKKEDHW